MPEYGRRAAHPSVCAVSTSPATSPWAALILRGAQRRESLESHLPVEGGAWDSVGAAFSAEKEV